MTYKELIEKALNGRSVNKAAKEIGLRQVYLNRYKNNKSLPNYCDALILAKEAGINAAEAFEIFAEEERTRKEQKREKISKSFKPLIKWLNPRRDWLPA